jgi:hypothetical protein
VSDVPNAAPSAAPSPASTPAPAAAPAKSAAPTSAKNATPAAKAAPSGEAKAPTAADKLAGTAQADAKPEAPAETAEQKAERKEAERRKYKLKVDGQLKDVELTDDEIAIRLQKDEAAEVRMAKAAETQKQFAQFVEMLEKDPVAAAKLLNPKLDLEAAMEKRLAEKYRREMMSEQDRANLEREEKLAEYERKEKERTEAEQARVQKEHDDKFRAETEQQWIDALNTSDLEKSKRTLFMMAQVAKQNLAHGVELSPAQMAQEVRRQIESDVKYVTGGLKGEKLVKLLGPDVVKEILRTEVERVKGSMKPTPAPAPVVKDEDPEPLKKTARDSMRSFKKWARE